MAAEPTAREASRRGLSVMLTVLWERRCATPPKTRSSSRMSPPSSRRRSRRRGDDHHQGCPSNLRNDPRASPVRPRHGFTVHRHAPWRDAGPSRGPALDLDKKVIQVREAIEETKVHGIRFKAPKTKAARRDITLPDLQVDALRDFRKEHLGLRLKLGTGKLPDDPLLLPAWMARCLPRSATARPGATSSSRWDSTISGTPTLPS